MATLSDKVTATVKGMGLEGAAWQMPEIRWTKQLRQVRDDVKCPECNGTRHCRYDAAHNPIPFVDDKSFNAFHEYRRAAQNESGRMAGYGTCRRCARNGYSYGTVRGWVERMVDVGTPVWPDGTRFDSRFHHCDCGACGKNGIVSGFVPMFARDAAGTAHGVWLGRDCAGKFFELSKEAKKALGKPETHVLDRA